MRLVDALLRQGHLSETALVDALMTGRRPAHLDRCDICGDRALALGRGLDGLRAAAIEAADQAFPAERLTAQQGQILRRLEQLDEPTRVIAFPAAGTTPMRQAVQYRVAPGWIGVAAAAGLIIGAVGGQLTARFSGAAAQPSPAAVGVAPTPAPAPVEPEPVISNASLLEMDLESFIPEPLGAINELTPRTTIAGLARSARVE